MKMILTLASLALVATSPVAAESWTGRASVIDGDTIQIEGAPARFRLAMVDAPESSQTCYDANGSRYLCGSMSAEALSSLIGRNGIVTCMETDRDRYGRVVALCERDGYDLNGSMVATGWAVEYTSYSDGRYSSLQEEARRNGAGIWQGQFEMPWDWRRGNKKSASASTPAVVAQASSPSGCDIKGNISGSGKIYHRPGGAFYDRTSIDEASGERWFCSESEAQAAGWRASGR